MTVSWIDRRPRQGLVFLALLFAVQISSLWYPTPDASGYLSIARNVAAGHGPANLGSRQIYLAPGYPLLISPAFLTGDRPFLLLSFIHWLLALILVLGVYVWARRHMPASALLLTAVAMVNVELWNLYRRTLSETAFMALLVWEINLLHWAGAAATARLALWRTGVASLGMVALALTRQAGLTVAAGFGLALCLDAWRGKISWSRALSFALLVGVPATLAVAGLARYDRAMAAVSGAPTYVDQIADASASWSSQVLEGLRLRISEGGRLIVPGMFKAYGRRGHWWNVNVAVYVSLAGLLWWGWAKWVARTRDLWALTLPFYVGLYVIWPFDQATRFTVPMLPLLLACIWTVLEFLGRHRDRIFGGLLAGHLVMALGYWLCIDLPRAREDAAQWPVVRQIADILKMDGGAVLGVDVPPDTLWMLQFALDRRVGEHRADLAVAPDIRWIIASCSNAQFDGFAIHAELGKYRILRRREPDRKPAWFTRGLFQVTGPSPVLSAATRCSGAMGRRP